MALTSSDESLIACKLPLPTPIVCGVNAVPSFLQPMASLPYRPVSALSTVP